MQQTPPLSPTQTKAATLFNQAIQATRANQLAKAVALYQQVVALDPKAAAAWVNLGVLLGRQRRFDDGIAALQKAIRLEPKEAGFLAQLAYLEWGAGRGDEAIVTAKAALALSPKNSAAQHTLAGVYLSQKRYAEAIVALQAWSALEPRNPAILGTLATAQMDAKRTDDALATLRKLTQRFPKELNALLMRGDLAGRLGVERSDRTLFTEARDSYQRAFRLEPKNFRAGFNAAIAAEQAGDLTGALTALEALRERFPDKAVVRHSLALAYLRDGRRTPEDRVALGLKEAEAAVGREPKNPEFATTLGYMVLSQGASKEYGTRAARVFQAALKLAPKNNRAQRGLVEALLVQSAWSEAIPLLRQLLKSTPDDDALRRKLAATLQAAGKPLEAVEELHVLAKNQPKETQALREIARLYESLGQLEAAEKTLEEARGRAPGEPGVLLELGNLQVKTKHYESARTHFLTVLEKTPLSSDAYSGLIALLEQQEKKDEALAIRERWVRADPKNNKARYTLGMLYADAGRENEALTLLRGLTLQQNDPQRNLYRQAIAELHRKKGRFGDEANELKSLLNEEPNNEELKRRLADALERAGKPQEAEAVYVGLIQRAPASDISYRLKLIALHDRIGKRDMAVQEAEDIVVLRSSSDEARALLIQLRIAQQKPEAIAPFFEKIALSDPNHPNPYMVQELEAWFQREKTPEKYAAFTERLIQTYPKSERAWKYRAQLQEQQKDNAGALQSWQKATELGSVDPEAPLRWGRLLEVEGKKKEAIAAYTLSVKRQRTPSGIEALQRLGAPIPK